MQYLGATSWLSSTKHIHRLVDYDQCASINKYVQRVTCGGGSCIEARVGCISLTLIPGQCHVVQIMLLISILHITLPYGRLSSLPCIFVSFPSCRYPTPEFLLGNFANFLYLSILRATQFEIENANSLLSHRKFGCFDRSGRYNWMQKIGCKSKIRLP